ncbi:MAG: hypothetical protein HC852_03655 [Acaryochloridaceae cyanobacterium RU_4_10]|nr:hypothetical protein [Acaryochloridaceae cyanobacterium RU_4_10]
MPQLQPESLPNLSALTPQPQDWFEPFPLADLQQAYWIGRGGEFELGQVAGHSYLELEDTFDLKRLNQAWQTLIDRHAMLRAIVLPDGTQQVLQNLPPYQFRVVDLQDRDPDTVQAQLTDVRDRMSHQVLPSDRCPCLTFKLPC